MIDIVLINSLSEQIFWIVTVHLHLLERGHLEELNLQDVDGEEARWKDPWPKPRRARPKKALAQEAQHQDLMENPQPPLQVVKFWFKIYIFLLIFSNKKAHFLLFSTILQLLNDIKKLKWCLRNRKSRFRKSKSMNDRVLAKRDTVSKFTATFTG